MKTQRLIYLIFILLISSGLVAQDESAIENTGVEPGSVISGTLNNNAPRQVYSIDGTRGEVIRLQLTVVEGTLDPVLTVFDSRGMLLLYRDDTAGTLDIDVSLNIERNDTYFVIISRFAESAGTTQGEFELQIERVGILGEQGSTLRYSVPVTNRISATQPQVYYTFDANAGDILNIDMIRSSGTLDPYLQVVDSRRFVIAENDDQRNANSHNASIEGLVIEDAGTYIVIATRYGQAGGDSAGTFVLTVYESQFSGLSNSTLAPATLSDTIPVESTLDEQQYEQFYTFQAQRDELITLTMERTSGNLDAYLSLANAGLNTLLENDDGGAG
ncbi:MAG: PPC domain-containing protein [Aggregatilineales bacterium]